MHSFENINRKTSKKEDSFLFRPPNNSKDEEIEFIVTVEHDEDDGNESNNGGSHPGITVIEGYKMRKREDSVANISIRQTTRNSSLGTHLYLDFIIGSSSLIINPTYTSFSNSVISSSLQRYM